MLCGPEGPLNARIVIIGEAPGVEEERLGRPFIGGSGQILSQVLAKAGIDRSQCYITNVMTIRPPQNDFGYFYEDKKRNNPSRLLVDGITRLEGELARLTGKYVIMPLGTEPLRAVTGLRSIEKWRGSILTSRHGKVVSSYHPAAVLRDYHLRPILELDAKRVARESVSPSVRVQENQFHIDSSFDVTIQLLRRIVSGALISFDIETVGDLIRCLGIGVSATEALCIPFMSRANPKGYWSAEEEAAIVFELFRLLRHPKVKVRGQNLLYDCQYTFRHWHFVPRVAQDTMLSHHSCFSGMKKSLDFQASIYADYYVNWKPDKSSWKEGG